MVIINVEVDLRPLTKHQKVKKGEKANSGLYDAMLRFINRSHTTREAFAHNESKLTYILALLDFTVGLVCIVILGMVASGSSLRVNYG